MFFCFFFLPGQQLEEKCVYRTSVDNTRWTVCERWAYINSSIFGFSRAIQAFALERYKKNVQKTQKGFEHILSRLYIMHDPSHSNSTDTSRVHGGKEGKLKETARKASELAQRPVLSTPGQIS